MSRVGTNAQQLIEATDPIWQERRIVQVVSKASNQFNSIVGTGFGLGDMSQTGVPLMLLPPTISQNNRGLVRLCGLSIPALSGIHILGFNQLATIISPVVTGTIPVQGFQFFELNITTPTWSFPDGGNINWVIQYQPTKSTGPDSAPIFGDPGVPLGASTGFEPLDAALLYRPPFGPYRNPGPPPGFGVETLGSMNEIRSPWGNTNLWLNYFLPGPGTLVFYASVYQPNPATRPMPLVPFTASQLAALGPEDRFVQTMPNVIYGRVAGAMTVEILPDKRHVGDGPARSLLEYNQKFPSPQRPHGNTASLTSLMSGPGKKRGKR
jgi:hypothetical protein